MKRKRNLALAALAALAVAVLSSPAALTVEPLLANGSFEGGSHRAAVYWTPSGGPFYTEFGEVSPPTGWTAWWREEFLCAGTNDWRTGRPEVKVISVIPDPERIHGGGQAVQWFTFWRCSEGGLFQQVAVKPGRYYQFSIYAHSWYSQCSLRPHSPPLDTDCKTPIDWAQDYLSVGIDPTGGLDPTASTVEWGLEQKRYGRYSKVLETGRVKAEGDTITVIVKREASHPLKHVDLYLDDALLRDVTYQVFLSLMRR